MCVQTVRVRRQVIDHISSSSSSPSLENEPLLLMFNITIILSAVNLVFSVIKKKQQELIEKILFYMKTRVNKC